MIPGWCRPQARDLRERAGTLVSRDYPVPTRLGGSNRTRVPGSCGDRLRSLSQPCFQPATRPLGCIFSFDFRALREAKTWALLDCDARSGLGSKTVRGDFWPLQRVSSQTCKTERTGRAGVRKFRSFDSGTRLISMLRVYPSASCDNAVRGGGR